ncbi:MAG: hypothetical protein AAB821_00405 [Patescibacteria group bacterium]
MNNNYLSKMRNTLLFSGVGFLLILPLLITFGYPDAGKDYLYTLFFGTWFISILIIILERYFPLKSNNSIGEVKYSTFNLGVRIVAAIGIAALIFFISIWTTVGVGFIVVNGLSVSFFVLLLWSPKITRS